MSTDTKKFQAQYDENGKTVITPEQVAADHDCDIAGRDHKWHWKWDIAGHWSDAATCAHCGRETQMQRNPE